MVNVYQQVDQNRTKSFLVIVGFFIFVVLAGWLISQILEWGAAGLFLAFVFASGSTLISYYQGDKIALSLARAKPANRRTEPEFYSAVENLARAAQVPTPKVYVSPDPAMNAFATGRNPEKSSLCVTQGLLNNLNQTELEGVIGHEIAHIKNLDTRLFAIVAILIGMIALLSRFAFYSRPNRDRDQGGGILFIFGMAAIILSPLIGQLIQLSISRRREFLADASSAFLTRQPSGLIGALKKLAQNHQPLQSANNATAHFYIVNPFFSRGRLSGLAKLFNTHPPIEDRIAELEKMR
ncbi:MAG: M48 family metallopeptidase [Candidatus Shapirobacteria bacterium]|nr:M48 family metallopeptidase [Candidatus Shapirobacteria bacterium]MDD5073724.1 M48 family metallopeptidase [Candidatus Shapirobacteria bacterium]MDD5481713.1 M48 family metallopeptidase [Candidatus Shapirobacteria bacterium]